MAKNKELLDAIRNDKVDPVKRRAALEALLKADPNKADDFRKAIVNHKEFWTTADKDLMIHATETVHMGFTTRPIPNYFDIDTFLNPNDTPNTFPKLHQAAAEKRVQLGLKEASNEVLVEILQNNPEETRAYLAEKFDFLKASPSWAADVVVPAVVTTLAAPAKAKNLSESVLTNDAIDMIKQLACDQYLLNKIPTVINKDHLQDLLGSDNTKFKAALNSLKVPLELSTYTLNPEVRDALGKRIEVLKQEAAQTSVNQYISGLSTEKLLAFKSHLEADLDTFKLNLPGGADLSQEALKKARDDIAFEFLKVYLPTVTATPELAVALNVKDEELIAKLKAIPQLKAAAGSNNDYLDTAITKDKMLEVRRYLTQALITQKKDDDLKKLIELEAAEPLAKFKTKLADLGVTNADWVEDMASIKQWARSRAIDIQVNQASKFGGSAHPKLVKALNELPVAKQRELLGLTPEHKVRLERLMNATESHIVKHYLGDVAEDVVSGIVDENKRLALFKRIHNFEVARILANFKPSIPLDEDMVNEINKTFWESSSSIPISLTAPLAAPSSPGTSSPALLTPAPDVEEYKKLINAIKVASGVQAEDATFYREFGLDAKGSAFDSSSTAKAVFEQHRHNTTLFYEYIKTGTPKVDKSIIEVFLNDKKTTRVTYDDVKAVIGRIPPASGLTDLQNNLKAKLPAGLAPLIKLHNAEVDRRELTTDTNTATTRASTPLERMTTSNLLKTRFETVKKSSKAVTANSKAIETVNKTKEVHLMSPAFQGKARTESPEMLNDLKTLADQVDLTVEQLRRNREELIALSNSMPESEYFDTAEYKNYYQSTRSAESKKDLRELEHSIKKLKIEVGKELKTVEASLTKYEEAQANLRGDKGILEVVRKAGAGEKQFTYQTEGFQYEVVAESELATVGDTPPSPLPLAQAVVGGPADTLAFLMGDKIGQEKVGVHVFSKTVSGQPLKGRFLERHSVSSGEPVVTLTVTEAPKIPRGAPKEVREAVEREQVQFYLGLAVQTLANQDEKPNAKRPVFLTGTDADYLKHYYSALCSLGVDKSAIQVRSTSGFDPTTEHGTLGFGFNKESLKYTLYESKNRMLLEEAKKQLKTLRDQKSDKSGERLALAKAAKKTDDAELIKEQEKVTKPLIEKEGPASKGPR